LRKSYRSLINAGLRELKPRVLSASNFSLEEFEGYRLLHLKAAGRETRSRLTWEINARMIAQDEAFLVVGCLGEQLVTGCYCNVAAGACYYSNAASDRDLQSKVASHAILWTGILEAKRRACAQFETGEVLYATQHIPSVGSGPDADRFPSEKEIGISNFKRGFGGETVSSILVAWKGD
jgi:hypothetical protein